MVQIPIMPDWLIWMIMGMGGAMANYLFAQLPNPESEWKIVLPSIKEDGNLYLGVLLYLILGASAGWLAPSFIGNGVNSFLAGYAFSSIFESLSRRVVKNGR